MYLEQCRIMTVYQLDGLKVPEQCESTFFLEISILKRQQHFDF